MRAFSSIPALLSALLAATACGSPLDPGTGVGGDFAIGRLSVYPGFATIVSGGTVQLRLTAQDRNGVPVTPSQVTWATSDPRIASVTADGLVTGHSNGASQVTALWGGINSRATITVVNSIELATPCSTGGGEPLLKASARDAPEQTRKKTCKTQ
jgi:hypothetical protein